LKWFVGIQILESCIYIIQLFSYFVEVSKVCRKFGCISWRALPIGLAGTEEEIDAGVAGAELGMRAAEGWLTAEAEGLKALLASALDNMASQMHHADNVG
jgi:hypothetical protein